MPAVIQHDVEPRQVAHDRAQERTVLLVADQYIDLRFLERLAVRVDVDAPDPGLGAEIFFPHLQRAALVDADLQHVDGAITGEVPVIDLESVPTRR